MLALLGIIGIVGAMRWFRRKPLPAVRLPIETAAPATTIRPVPRRWKPLTLLIGLCALALFTLLNLAESVPSAHLRFVLFVSGILMLLGGVGGIPHVRGLSRTDVYALLGLTLLALVLRLWQLEDAVRIFGADEAWSANAVMSFWDDNPPLLMPSLPSFSTGLYPYFQSLAVNLLGANLSGLRLVSVLFGTLTVSALYALACTLYDRKVALVAAVLLATFPPHLHFSRLALFNISETLFGVLALVYIADSLRGNRGWESRANFAFAGIMLGLTQYFYSSGRFLFVPLVAAWLAAISLKQLWTSERAWKRGWGLGLFLLTFTTLAVALPKYLVQMLRGVDQTFALSNMGWGSTYLSMTLPHDGLLEVLRTYPERYLLPVVQHFYATVDTIPYYYGGPSPMILPYVLPSCVVGVVLVLWRWRQAESLLMLLWLALGVLGISLVWPPTWTARFTPLFPVIALLAALGLCWLTSHLPQRFQNRLLAAIVSILALAQVGYYFVDHLPIYNRQIRPYHDYIDALHRMDDLPPGTPLYFITNDTMDMGFVYIAARYLGFESPIYTYTAQEITVADLLALPSNTAYAFFVDPDDTRIVALLRSVFTLDPARYSPYNVPPERQYVLYYAHPSAPPQAQDDHQQAEQPYHHVSGGYTAAG